MEKQGTFVWPENHRQVPIEDCGEPLVEIPRGEVFVFAEPHPYLELGAPYGESTPYAVRSGVLDALRKAALLLDEFHPGCRIKIYDAYRPIEVQAFMVEHVADQYCRKVGGILLREAEDEVREAAYFHAHGIWAPAIDDPNSPPPHSTGAAVDVTVIDASWREFDMWSAIDDPENAHPDAFLESDDPNASAFRRNRHLLNSVMESAGFTRLPHEWWHFSLGDQRSTFDKIRRGFRPADAKARYWAASQGIG